MEVADFIGLHFLDVSAPDFSGREFASLDEFREPRADLRVDVGVERHGATFGGAAHARMSAIASSLLAQKSGTGMPGRDTA